MINLSCRVFNATGDTLVAQLTEVWRSQSFLVWTQPAMTARDSGPDAPRWRVHPLDVLSGLLLLLKVSTDHELVWLWAVIDWSAINALCAPLYHNAQRNDPLVPRDDRHRDELAHSSSLPFTDPQPEH